MPRALAILLLSTALILAAVLLNACGGGHAKTRFVAAAPSAPGVDFLIDGKILASNLSFPASNGSYETISSGNHTVEVRLTGTTSDLVNASNVDFINRDQYTLYFTGLTPADETVNQVPDDNSPPDTGKIKLRFFHAAPSGPGHVDIYVVAPSTPITNLSPNISSLAYQQASTYLSLTASTYEIIVTSAGTKTPLLGDQTPPAFTAGQIRTLVLTEPPQAGCNMPLCMLELSDLN